VLKLKAVQPGSRIAVIAPASSARTDRVELGIKALRNMGYEPMLGRHTLGKAPQYFSGTEEERLIDLHAAFADPEIKAIICIRGGYGSNYLLEGLDLELVRRNAKPLFAYSDMTAIQTWMLDQAGLVSFHGPMVAADFYKPDGVHEASFQASLSGGLYAVGAAEGLRVLNPGHARGTLHGGCLSLLVASLGTPYAARLEGGLLFLEDVGAKPYQVDRMLRQLILAGKLDGMEGIVFGEMLNCVSPGSDENLIERVIQRVLEKFDGPIAIGLRSGHVSHGNVTLCFGVEARLDLPAATEMDSQEPQLRFLEPAVNG
jgi:muramoyltetrapeptide carboxypeptidase